MKKLALLIGVISTFATGAAANELDSTHGDWNVYTNGKETCYIASVPTAETGTFKKRGQPYVLVNNKSSGDEINVSSGYPYKSKVDVELVADGKKFTLFSQGENAWAKDANGDANIITAMKSGSKLEIKGISTKGSYSTDTYSLKGVSAAFKRMKEICS